MCAINYLWFDQDNTLYDYHEAVHRALNVCLEMIHERFPSTGVVLDTAELARVRAEITPLARREGMDLVEARCEAFRRTLDRYAKPDDGLASALSDAYFANLCKGIRPFPEVTEALVALADEGYVLGVLSNGICYLEELGLAHLFEHRIYANDVLVYKPEAAIFDRALALTGARPEECLLVGDSCACDVIGARDAGWTGVWVNRDGCRWESDAEAPDHVMESLADLPPLITALNANSDTRGEQPSDEAEEF